MRRLLVLVLALGFIISACGQSAQPTTTAPEQPTVAAAPATAAAPTAAIAATASPAATTPSTGSSKTIKIGVLNPTTGQLASFGKDTNAGIEMYFNSINNKVGAASVELVFADTAGDPQQALEQARRLVGQEKVDLLMGIVNSAVVPPMAQFADQEKVPLVLTIGGAQVATGPNRSPYVFRTAMANGQQDRPLGWYVASKLGLKRAATLAWDFLVGVERVTGFTSTFTQAGGTVVLQQKPPLGTTDYGPFVGQVNPDEVDVVYAFFSGPGAISFAQQMRQFGLTPKLQLVASDYFTSGVLGSMGDNATGLVQGAQYVPTLDNAENQKFVQMVKAKNMEPGAYLEEGFLSASVVARAIESLGGDVSNKQSFLDALGKVQMDTPSGPFKFDGRGQAIRNVYITRVEKGADGTIAQKVIDVVQNVSQDWTP